jgi:hypothetical protein
MAVSSRWRAGSLGVMCGTRRRQGPHPFEPVPALGVPRRQRNIIQQAVAQGRVWRGMVAGGPGDAEAGQGARGGRGTS